jgi:UrcA family protein
MTKFVVASLLATATLALGIGSAAHSAPLDRQTVSTVVRFGDLDLSNPEGAKAVLTRIRHAAKQVCEPAPETPLDYPYWRSCVAKATGGAVSRLNSPMVTAAYSGKAPSLVRLADVSSH